MAFTALTPHGAAGLMVQIADTGLKRLFARTLRGPINGQLPWAGVISKNATRAVLEDLAEQVFTARWDSLEIGPFPDFDHITAEFVEICRGRAAAADERTADFHAINGLRSLEELIEAQSKAPRKNHRRAMRLVDGNPGNDLVVFSGADAGQGLERFFEIDRRSWKAERGEALLSSPDLARYYQSLCDRYGAAGEAAIVLVRIGGRDVAGILMLLRNKIGYLFKSSFIEDAGAGAVSPGTLAILSGIRWLLEDRKVDRIMLLTEADYARHFSHGTVRMRACRLWSRRPRAAPVRALAHARAAASRRLTGRDPQ